MNLSILMAINQHFLEIPTKIVISSNSDQNFFLTYPVDYYERKPKLIKAQGQ